MLGTISLLGQVSRTIDTPDVAWSTLTPLLVLLGGAILLMVVAAMLPRRPRFSWHAWATILIAAGAIGAVVPLWFRVRDDGPMSVVAGALRIDGLSLFLTVVICGSVILASLLTDDYLRREDLPGPEGYVLLLLSASGGVVMASANDLVVMFLGLEVLSLAVYVLAGLHLRRQRSGEAALKYFVLGGFSSAFFLYGIALVYGATGTTNLAEIQDFLATNALQNDVLLLGGFALLLVGFAFKVAAVPFHAWAPDVYEGSPSPVVIYMASGVKAAAFAGMLRVFVYAFTSYQVDWQPIVYVLAVLTLLVGSILAVVQTNVKRMLAYSSIAHAGFILVAVQAASEKGVQSALFYLATYAFMVAGSFGVVTIVGRRGDNRHALSDYNGLAKAEPLLAFAFLVFLLAQAGVPFTSGLWAKFYVIGAAVEARSFWLALIAMLSSVISAFLYLRIVLAMYAGGDEDDAAERPPRLRVPGMAKLALVIALIATIGFGFVPGPLNDASKTAVPSITASR